MSGDFEAAYAAWSDEFGTALDDVESAAASIIDSDERAAPTEAYLEAVERLRATAMAIPGP